MTETIFQTSVCSSFSITHKSQSSSLIYLVRICNIILTKAFSLEKQVLHDSLWPIYYGNVCNSASVDLV